MRILLIKPEQKISPLYEPLIYSVNIYEKELKSLGHDVNIINLGDPYKSSDYDIVDYHINEYYNISDDKYILSLYTNMDMFNNKEQYLSLIEKSLVTIVRNNELLKMFNSDKIINIPLFIDIDKYKDKKYEKSEHRLLHVLPFQYNRQITTILMEISDKMKLPLTIVVPYKGTLDDIKNDEYDYVNIIDITNEDELIDMFNYHTIYLQPYNIETDIPDINSLKSLSCGVPVIFNMFLNSEENIPKIKDMFTEWINNVIKNYDDIKNNINIKKQNFQKIESLYKLYLNNKNDVYDTLLNEYQNITKYRREFNNIKVYLSVNYNNGPSLKIDSENIDKREFKVDFIDIKNNKIIFSEFIKIGQESKVSYDRYVQWLIRITDLDTGDISTFELELENMDVLIKHSNIGDYYSLFNSIKEFKNLHNCKVYCLKPEIDDNLIKIFENDIFFIDNQDEIEPFITYTIDDISKSNEILDI